MNEAEIKVHDECGTGTRKVLIKTLVVYALEAEQPFPHFSHDESAAYFGCFPS